jgi:serine/threonine-protein kinase
MDPSQLQPGHRLDRYELLCPLAYGGMASVWLARFSGRLGFERLVVVKMILPQFSQDPRFQQMFLDEARIASKIESSNVARILDVGEHEGSYFLVMEWIDGDSLSKILRAAELRKERIPVGVALRIAADVATGLHAAHSLRERDGTHLGVVHRDVSPQNVLIANSGATMLIDFGVAKARDRAAQDTTAGQLKGKLRYMAPEQAMGRSVDHRADLWALGALLYEMFSGGLPPYDGPNDVATLHLLTSGAPRQPLPPETAPVVQAIIDRALAQAPDDRFSSALELNQALENAMAELNEPTPPATVATYTTDLLAERKAARKVAVDREIDQANRRGAPPAPASSSASGSIQPLPPASSGTMPLRVSFPTRSAPPVVMPVSSSSQPSAIPSHPLSQPGPRAGSHPAIAGGPQFPQPFPMDPQSQAALAEMPSIATTGTMGPAAVEYPQPVEEDARRRRYLTVGAGIALLALAPVLAAVVFGGPMRRSMAKNPTASESLPRAVPSAIESSSSPPTVSSSASSPSPAPPSPAAPAETATASATAPMTAAAPRPAPATTHKPTRPKASAAAPPTRPDRGF